jgi:hypothetical protein
MTDPNALFRKAALDKLSSPERLDVLMTVTSPRGWLALLTLAGLLGVLVGWIRYGSIPTRVEGQGMLIRGSFVPPATGSWSTSRSRIRTTSGRACGWQ